jgi:hypothetical protein
VEPPSGEATSEGWALSLSHVVWSRNNATVRRITDTLEFTNRASYAIDRLVQAASIYGQTDRTSAISWLENASGMASQMLLKEKTHSEGMQTKSRRFFMSSFERVVLKMGLLSLLSVMPLAAQMYDGLNFTTSFPFYAGNAKMPAGSYRISQSDINSSVLQIQSTDRANSAFVKFVPTHAEQPHPQTDVTFHRYGNTDYLNRIWLNGQRYGMKVEPTESETKAAASASVLEHSVVASKWSRTIVFSFFVEFGKHGIQTPNVIWYQPGSSSMRNGGDRT